jgi:hypothetical protein
MLTRLANKQTKSGTLARKSMRRDQMNDNKSTSGASVVLRRRLNKVSSVSDFNKNLDREKNVYRQSIDSNKLKLLSSINLDSHRWSQMLSEHNNPMEWLSLENASMAK